MLPFHDLNDRATTNLVDQRWRSQSVTTKPEGRFLTVAASEVNHLVPVRTLGLSDFS